MKKLFLSILLAFVAMTGMGQTIVRGHVVNERGESIEYVSIGFEDDSVGVISDIKGHFEITIPKGRSNDLSFSHVSYLTAEVPYQEYASGKELTVVLKDKVVELTEVVIGKKNKPKTIVGKGVLIPGAAFGINPPNSDHPSEHPEGGVTFSCNKDYVISDIIVKVIGCTFKQCTVSINLYEMKGKQFVNILQKPIYEKVSQGKDAFDLDIRPEETLLLKRKTDYYLSISVVDSDGPGMLYIKASMKKGLIRRTVKGKTKHLPACPAILVKGYEVDG